MDVLRVMCEEVWKWRTMEYVSHVICLHMKMIHMWIIYTCRPFSYHRWNCQWSLIRACLAAILSRPIQKIPSSPLQPSYPQWGFIWAGITAFHVWKAHNYIATNGSFFWKPHNSPKLSSPNCFWPSRGDERIGSCKWSPIESRKKKSALWSGHFCEYLKT